MSLDRPANNPQQPEFGSEAMIYGLAAQADAIWPLERPLFKRYRAHAILDVGCGTGEITRRLADLWPGAKVMGLDLEEAHLVRAREQSPKRVEYVSGDAYALPFPDDSFDLVVCRHVLQGVQDPTKVLAEMARVSRSALHLLSEDYGMIQFHPTQLDNDRFWREGVIGFGKSIGVDLAIGRRTPTLLADLGLQDIRCDYLTVDTLTNRPAMQRIWAHWRAAYETSIAEAGVMDPDEVHAHWEEMQAALANPQGYAVWQVPVLSAKVPPKASRSQ